MKFTKDELKAILYALRADISCEPDKSGISIQTINNMVEGAIENYSLYKTIEQEHGKINLTVLNWGKLASKIEEAIEEF